MTGEPFVANLAPSARAIRDHLDATDGWPKGMRGSPFLRRCPRCDGVDDGPDGFLHRPGCREQIRSPPARGLQVRLYLDSVNGPLWLELLGMLAQVKGVVAADTFRAEPT